MKAKRLGKPIAVQATLITKWFDSKRGFGFLISNHQARDHLDTNIFVHFSELQMKGFRTLVDNQVVVADIHQRNDGRLIAQQVHPKDIIHHPDGTIDEMEDMGILPRPKAQGAQQHRPRTAPPLPSVTASTSAQEADPSDTSASNMKSTEAKAEDDEWERWYNQQQGPSNE